MKVKAICLLSEHFFHSISFQLGKFLFLESETAEYPVTYLLINSVYCYLPRSSNDGAALKNTVVAVLSSIFFHFDILVPALSRKSFFASVIFYCVFG